MAAGQWKLNLIEATNPEREDISSFLHSLWVFCRADAGLLE